MFHEIKVHCSFVFYIDCINWILFCYTCVTTDKLTQSRTALVMTRDQCNKVPLPPLPNRHSWQDTRWWTRCLCVHTYIVRVTVFLAFIIHKNVQFIWEVDMDGAINYQISKFKITVFPNSCLLPGEDCVVRSLPGTLAGRPGLHLPCSFVCPHPHFVHSPVPVHCS